MTELVTANMYDELDESVLTPWVDLRSVGQICVVLRGELTTVPGGSPGRPRLLGVVPLTRSIDPVTRHVRTATSSASSPDARVDVDVHSSGNANGHLATGPTPPAYPTGAAA